VSCSSSVLRCVARLYRASPTLGFGACALGSRSVLQCCSVSVLQIVSRVTNTEILSLRSGLSVCVAVCCSMLQCAGLPDPLSFSFSCFLFLSRFVSLPHSLAVARSFSPPPSPFPLAPSSILPPIFLFFLFESLLPSFKYGS